MKLRRFIAGLLGLIFLLVAAACSEAAAVTLPEAETAAPADCPNSSQQAELCLPSVEITPLSPADAPVEVVPFGQSAGPQIDSQDNISPDLPLPTETAELLAEAAETGNAGLCLDPPQGCLLPDLKLDQAVYDPFWLKRPIAAPARDQVDTSYRFGSTQDGRHDPHHGVELVNPQGTPVLAAADGVVVIAGNDLRTMVGPYTNFYGQLVVLKHNFPGLPLPLYTLYGHLSKVSVAVSDTVKTGQLLGEVGMSGVAIGTHLHFEVRYGRNHYFNVCNPELFLKPHRSAAGKPNAALAGRIINSLGGYVEVQNIVIERLVDPTDSSWAKYFLNTYEEKALAGQPPLGESFAIGDLPAGRYRLTFVHRNFHEIQLDLKPGTLTWVTFRVDQ